MVNTEAFRQHAVIDGDASEAQLTLYLEAAQQYMKNAGVAKPTVDDALYELAVYQLATYYYDNRGPAPVGVVNQVPVQGLQGIIHQLKED